MPNIAAIKSPVVEGFYNVASGVETSLLDLANALLTAMDSDLAVEFRPARAVNGVPGASPIRGPLSAIWDSGHRSI